MDIQDLFRQLSIDHKEVGQHHHITQGWVGIDCPFCSPNSGKFKMGFNLRGKYFSCWSCGSKDITKVLLEASGRPWGEVHPLVQGADLQRQKKPEKTQGNYTPPAGVGPLLPVHKRYLWEERGLDPEYLEEVWQTKGIGLAVHMAWSIFIPVHFRGRPVSWVTRSLSSKGRRYNAASAAQESKDHHTLLFGEDHARGEILVLEGPLDVYKIGPGAVGTFGTGFSPAQLLRISRYPSRWICFDSEKTAQERARQLCDKLEVLPGKTANVILDAKDPGEASDREIKRLRRTCLRDR